MRCSITPRSPALGRIEAALGALLVPQSERRKTAKGWLLSLSFHG